MKPRSQRKLNMSLQLFLRIKHPSLDSEQLSVALDIESEHTIHAREPVSAAGRRTLHSEPHYTQCISTAGFDQGRVGIDRLIAKTA